MTQPRSSSAPPAAPWWRHAEDQQVAAARDAALGLLASAVRDAADAHRRITEGGAAAGPDGEEERQAQLRELVAVANIALAAGQRLAGVAVDDEVTATPVPLMFRDPTTFVVGAHAAFVRLAAQAGAGEFATVADAVAAVAQFVVPGDPAANDFADLQAAMQPVWRGMSTARRAQRQQHSEDVRRSAEGLPTRPAAIGGMFNALSLALEVHLADAARQAGNRFARRHADFAVAPDRGRTSIERRLGAALMHAAATQSTLHDPSLRRVELHDRIHRSVFAAGISTRDPAVVGRGIEGRWAIPTEDTPAFVHSNAGGTLDWSARARILAENQFPLHNVPPLERPEVDLKKADLTQPEIDRAEEDYGVVETLYYSYSDKYEPNSPEAVLDAESLRVIALAHMADVLAVGHSLESLNQLLANLTRQQAVAVASDSTEARFDDPELVRIDERLVELIALADVRAQNVFVRRTCDRLHATSDNAVGAEIYAVAGEMLEFADRTLRARQPAVTSSAQTAAVMLTDARLAEGVDATLSLINGDLQMLGNYAHALQLAVAHSSAEESARLRARLDGQGLTQERLDAAIDARRAARRGQHSTSPGVEGLTPAMSALGGGPERTRALAAEMAIDNLRMRMDMDGGQRNRLSRAVRSAGTPAAPARVISGRATGLPNDEIIGDLRRRVGQAVLAADAVGDEASLGAVAAAVQRYNASVQQRVVTVDEAQWALAAPTVAANIVEAAVGRPEIDRALAALPIAGPSVAIRGIAVGREGHLPLTVGSLETAFGRRDDVAVRLVVQLDETTYALTPHASRAVDVTSQLRDATLRLRSQGQGQGNFGAAALKRAGEPLAQQFGYMRGHSGAMPNEKALRDATAAEGSYRLEYLRGAVERIRQLDVFDRALADEVRALPAADRERFAKLMPRRRINVTPHLQAAFDGREPPPDASTGPSRPTGPGPRGGGGGGPRGAGPENGDATRRGRDSGGTSGASTAAGGRGPGGRPRAATRSVASRRGAASRQGITHGSRGPKSVRSASGHEARALVASQPSRLAVISGTRRRTIATRLEEALQNGKRTVTAASSVVTGADRRRVETSGTSGRTTSGRTNGRPMVNVNGGGAARPSTGRPLRQPVGRDAMHRVPPGRPAVGGPSGQSASNGPAGPR